MRKLSLYILITILLSTSGAIAQLRIVPVKRASGYELKNTPNSRLEEEVIEIPFWDDFSTSYGQPDIKHWVNSNNVWIGNGMAIDPPSINTASFDGIDANGKPYSLDPLSDGQTDILTSAKINLEGYSSVNNIRLSFFYQIKGNGEIPNNNDSLRLEFLDIEGNWNKQWTIKGSDAPPDIFIFEDVAIVEEQFLFNEFQFRFISFGRQSGPFDTWNLDYVYLNSFDSRRDFPDRAISSGPTSFLQGFTAVPIDHFNQNPEKFLSLIKGSAYNLYDSLQPSSFSVIAKIQSLDENFSFITSYDTIALEEFSSFPNPLSTGRRKIELETGSSLNTDKIKSDSLVIIEMKMYMNTDDNQPPDYRSIYSPLDFRINDTVRSTQMLSNYYAYDDGTAEYAAGLNFAGDMVAVMFPFDNITDTLVSVDMYFPNFNTSGNKTIELLVMDSLRDNSEVALHSESFSIRPSEGINDFVRYDLSEKIIVKDTLYLGWRQTSAGNLDMGLDKNTNSGKSIFYNLDGTWIQNQSVEGSLMIRPVFGRGNLITSTVNPEENYVDVYPNPGPGIYKLMGNYDNIEVYDLSGSKVPYRVSEMLLDISNNPKGMYLLRIFNNHSVITRKVIFR